MKPNSTLTHRPIIREALGVVCFVMPMAMWKHNLRGWSPG